MDYYISVEKLYNEKQEYFSSIESDFKKSYDIPKYITRNTIKRVLAESFNADKKKYLQSKNSLLINLFYYYGSMLYFVFFVIFGRKNNAVRCDFIFEIWHKDAYKKFYENLIKLMSGEVVDLLITTHKFDKSSVKNYIYKGSRYFILRSISFKILINQINKFWLYQRLTFEANIDFTRLSILLVRYISLYETDSKNMHACSLISAADNNYNSYRYYIYKKNGIKNISLIQNGMRTGGVSSNHGDLYTFCDFYYGFGDKQIAAQSNMEALRKKSIGSLLLYNSISKLKLSTQISYDIVFIESIASHDSNYFKIQTYLKIVDNLCSYAIKNPNCRIYYRRRKKEVPVSRKAALNGLNSRLKKSGIIIDIDLEGNSYEAMQKSKIIMYYRTTMGIEGLALNKFVLNCNYDGDTFPTSKNEEIGVLIDSSYDAFERKVTYILRNLDNPEFAEYFKMQRLQYMNMNLGYTNPNKVIYRDLLKQNRSFALGE